MPLPLWLIPPLHALLVALYVAAPAVALIVGIYRHRRRDDSTILMSLVVQLVLGFLIGGGLCFAFAFFGDGQMIPGQVFLASYFGASLLLVLKGIDAGIRRVVMPEGRRPTLPRALVRGVLVLCVVIPWVMAAVMVYRPKVRPTFTPMDLAKWQYEDVSFPAADGGTVSAWWIPAQGQTSAFARESRPSGRTVILVHGLGANKGNQLIMARRLVPGGYNVLSIDMRAHGLSSGQFATLGLKERDDVIGAIRYLENRRPLQSEHIFGLGASQGAAALLAAATSEEPEGSRLEALAVYGTFENAGALMATVTRDYFPGPIGYLLRGIGLPLAEIHAGAPLRSFDLTPKLGNLWPRPLLIIHGLKDEIIPIDEGRRLFRDAPQPKSAIWINGTHNSIIADEDAAKAVEEFFRNARAIPII